MAKAKKQPKGKNGPFLAAAIFCDSVLEDKDGTLSVVRIVDGVTISITPDAPPEVPSLAHPVPVQVMMLVSFRSGDSPGPHRLKILVSGPNHKKTEVLNKDVTLSAEPNGGVNLKTNAGMLVAESGLYWIDVVLDGRTFTRMPLKVSVHRTEPMTTPAAGFADQKKSRSRRGK